MTAASRRAPALAARAARRGLFSRLRRLRRGVIEIRDGESRWVFAATPYERHLRATVWVEDPAFYLSAALGGTVGAGEAYVRGHWRCDDLTALVRILVANREVMQSLERGPARLALPLLRLGHRLRRNSRRGSRANIAAHYDLGNDFFARVLDPTMTYSCGLFESPQATLEEAAVAKYDRLCRKLGLQSEHHLLEIGTGWGGFAVHAASRYGCRVTTTTLSQRQYEWARRRVEREGLGNRVELLRWDYRDLRGRYDRLVSIEMIEAVGLRYLGAYFEACADLLRDDGLMALQAITIDERLFPEASRSVDFIQRFIFPGSALPSISALTSAVAKRSDLRFVHLEDISEHYPPTLDAWRQRLHAHRQELAELGYGESLQRMFEFYLCYCEGGFLERSIGDLQIVLAKPAVRELPEALGVLGGVVSVETPALLRGSGVAGGR